METALVLNVSRPFENINHCRNKPEGAKTNARRPFTSDYFINIFLPGELAPSKND
jgi:hypothetical protein